MKLPSRKRCVDIVVSATLLILALPFLLVTLLLTFIDGHKNPLFIQRRLGLNGKEFSIYKFRTLKSAPVGETPVHLKPDAKGISAISRFVRKSSLDELPQLVNVLLGDMSLIGPRPHALEYANYYATLHPRYYDRYKVRPGLACIVEVTRAHFLTDTPQHIKTRINIDLYYIRHASAMMDLKIFFKIFLHVARPFLGLIKSAAGKLHMPHHGEMAPAYVTTKKRA